MSNTRYRLELRQDKNKFWTGRVYDNGVLISELETGAALAKGNTMRNLNNRIEKYNYMNELTGNKAIPLFQKGQPYCDTIAYEKDAGASEPKAESQPKTIELPVAEVQQVNIKTQRKKVIPRKPFTPYGLNGYLVDKRGNIRLHLDRKASSKTITIPPDMFDMLADMVKATLAQGAIQ